MEMDRTNRTKDGTNRDPELSEALVELAPKF